MNPFNLKIKTFPEIFIPDKYKLPFDYRLFHVSFCTHAHGVCVNLNFQP